MDRSYGPSRVSHFFLQRLTPTWPLRLSIAVMDRSYGLCACQTPFLATPNVDMAITTQAGLAERSMANPAQVWLTGISSRRLILICAGWLSTQNTVSAMSADWIASAPA